MLKLSSITKDYEVKSYDRTKTIRKITHALKGISIEFRESEFVAILGPSGCGKTTLLNLVGGLDRYTDGELFINEVSTKEFNDRDWDTYRNHSVGFVFQSYNLIEHQSILANVMLALTMSGMPAAECKVKAMAALARVGLEGEEHKKPNQLSGGQMQRVAIARAIVNNPDIILADEPTGALDSDTSVQIMDILQELSKDNLVIMVTHNPELAATYATRIIRLNDGLITDDSNPYSVEMVVEEEEPVFDQKVSQLERNRLLRIFRLKRKKEKMEKAREKRKKGPLSSLKYRDSFKLSLSNLITKRGRTVLTSLAGSIGIIGITLVLSLSSGFGTYIDSTSENALSSYPLTVSQTNMDLTGALGILMTPDASHQPYDNEEEVYVGKVLSNLLTNLGNVFHPNDTADFKAYLEQNWTDDMGFIKYSYGTEMFMYSNYGAANPSDYVLVNPFMERVLSTIKSIPGVDSLSPEMLQQITSFSSSIKAWDELIDNRTLLDSQYELLGNSQWPTSKDEVVLVVDSTNAITDYMLFTIGLKSPADVATAMLDPDSFANTVYQVEDLIGIEYKVLTKCDYFVEKEDGSGYLDLTATNTDGSLRYNDDSDEVKAMLASRGLNVKVVGVVRPKEGVSGGAINGVAAYTKELTDYFAEYTLNSDVYKASVQAREDGSSENADLQHAISNDTRYNEWLKSIGVADMSTPQDIYLYANSFEAKDKIIALIDNYNAIEDAPDIKYTDTLGLLMSSITKILSAVTYVLVGFSAISLIVSSIMISIVIYTSVLERTKEIGILRSIGARKRDVARVFNTEAMLMGFVSGAIGVLFTFIIQYPVSALLKNMLGIGDLMHLVWWHALVMIVLSVVLSAFAGVIPSQIAAKKDPVSALRSE